MKRPTPEYVRLDVPKLEKKVKELNGKSGRKLQGCIEKLNNLLNEDPKENTDRDHPKPESK